jgi:superfamily II DNA or RNA helicase
MTRQLRDYQREAVEAVEDGWATTGGEPQAVVLPTGCGKTDVIAAHAVAEARAGGRTLVLADREELLDQVTERVGMHDPSIPIGRAQAGVSGGSRPILTAMVQTLRSPRRQLQCLTPTKIIVDECDLATAPSYQAVFDWAASGPREVRRMGVTATLSRPKPKRGELGLGDVWPHVAFSRDIQWAVDSGWLVRPWSKTVVADHVNLAKAKVRAGDYTDGELGEMVAQDVGQIFEAWAEYASDRITGAYWPTLDAARAACEHWAGQGVKAEIVTGTTPYAERVGIYRRLAEGVTRTVHSVGVLTRGWDCPPLSCVLMGRPTKMTHLYQQIIGRGLRPAEGKTDCLVLDVVGATRVNTLATLIDLYRAARVEDDRPAELAYCPVCTYPRPVPGLELSPLCECEREPLERDPNAGRELLPPGAARYVDHDLFAERGLPWQTTRGGRIFLALDERWLLLWPETDGTWSAVHLTAGPPRVGATVGEAFDIRPIVERVDMAAAKQVGEDWARQHAAAPLARLVAERSSAARPNYGLQARAARFKIANPERMSAGRLVDEINRARASARLDLL